ncbi:MAG: pyridoxamine 5'-phosphate oxidase family protein [Dehalococcoidia bacterium]
MALAMTNDEREAFLAGVHVGILSIAAEGRGPLAAPVWYAYEPGGEVRLVTGRGSAKHRLLEAAGRATLCVQEESLPYRYVTVEGPVTLGAPDYERDVLGIAVRYLGERAGRAYAEGNGGPASTAQSVLVTLRPERWRSEDYGRLGR